VPRMEPAQASASSATSARAVARMLGGADFAVVCSASTLLLGP
jgi:hypothetical protein